MNTRYVLALASLVLAGASSAFSAAGARPQTPAAARVEAPPRLVAGMLRADGILLPFAAYDGKKWSTPWQGRLGTGFAPELPANIEAIPEDWWGGAPATSWKLWPLNGDPPKPFKLISPAMVRVGMIRQLGLRTDQPPVPPVVPPFELPYPKAGLAIAGDVDVKPIVNVSRLSQAARDFMALVRPEIEAAEERTLRTIRSGTGWRPPFERPARSAVAPELEAWYVTVSDDGERMSYMEAVKKYPLVPEDKGCGLESFVSGWVYHEDEQGKAMAKPKTALKAVVSYCDRRGVSYMLPFGQIRLRGKTHWIFQMSGQDHEWYAVVEGSPGRTKYVAEYQAGSLPAPPR